MDHPVKKLMCTVRGNAPDPRSGNVLLEQFGGANSELAAAMQCSIQGVNCDDPLEYSGCWTSGPRSGATRHRRRARTVALRSMEIDRGAAEQDGNPACAGPRRPVLQRFDGFGGGCEIDARAPWNEGQGDTGLHGRRHIGGHAAPLRAPVSFGIWPAKGIYLGVSST